MIICGKPPVDVQYSQMCTVSTTHFSQKSSSNLISSMHLSYELRQVVEDGWTRAKDWVVR